MTTFSAAMRHAGTRKTQEDYAVYEEITTAGGLELKVGIICDGTGQEHGHYFGARAAYMTAMGILHTLYASEGSNIPAILKKAVENANEQVHANEPGWSTLAMFVIHKNTLYIASVGNSVIGLVRHKRFIRLNTDHTYANQQVRNEGLSEREAYRHPAAHHLTQVIGQDRIINVDTDIHSESHPPQKAGKRKQQSLSLEEGDTIFAFSDGLLSYENAIPELNEALFIKAARKKDMREAASEIINELYAHSSDNLSLVVVQIHPPHSQPAGEKPLRHATKIVGVSSRQTSLLESTFTYLPFLQKSARPPGKTNEILLLPADDRKICKNHVLPVAQQLQYSVQYIDDIFAGKTIIQKIWSSLYYASLIIADCTGRKPDVFYELGIAHTLNKPVILIAQHETDIPFDIQNRAILSYSGNNEYESMQEFQSHLRDTLIAYRHEMEANSRQSAAPGFGEPATNTPYKANIFMAMSFASSMRFMYRDYIMPVARQLQMTIKYGADFFTNHRIIHDIWSAIYHADLLIADCTGRNPNVFYEIGMAHAIGKPVILMTQTPDDVPATLHDNRYIHYRYDPDEMPLFQEKLQDAILKILGKK